MDDKWFRKRQKELGVTAEDIAREMGRARSNVSHIYSGQQRMSLDWARAFAKVLQVSVDEVLRRAGALEPQEAQPFAPGFAESDAAIFMPKASEVETTERIAAGFGGDRPGIDVWTVRSDALQLVGYLPGDRILVDTHQSELCKPGDIVIAQAYNMESGTAETLLRRYEPPMLIGASARPQDRLARIVDGSSVVIRGKVIASWRQQ